MATTRLHILEMKKRLWKNKKFEGVEIHKEIHRQLLTQFQKHVTEFESTKVLSRGFLIFESLAHFTYPHGIDMKYSEVINQQHK